MHTHPERRAWGERHGRAILTEDAVRHIRARYAAGGVTYKTIAGEHAVTGRTIAAIVTRQIWRNVA